MAGSPVRRVTFELDRLVLTHTGLTPEQGQRLRAWLEVELRRLLIQEPGLAGQDGGVWTDLSVPGPAARAGESEQQLARRLARCCLAALRRLG